MNPEPDLRSVLFVPGDDARKIDRARQVPADLVIIDLEDAVSEQRKDPARQLTQRAVSTGPWACRRLGVRVSAPASAHMSADINALQDCQIDWLFIPKVNAASDVEHFTGRIADGPRPAHIGVLLESPAAVLNAHEIARQDSVDALMLGTADYCAELGIRESVDRSELEYPRAHVAMVAASTHILSIDAPFYQALTDIDAVWRDAVRGRQLGYRAKAVIHPTHIPLVHRAWAPSDDDVAWAQDILAATARMRQTGAGIGRVESTMIDQPIIEQAQAILERLGHTDRTAGGSHE